MLRAFSVAIGLFAGFLIADEVFIVYASFSGVAATHFRVLCALLLCLLVVIRTDAGVD